MLPLTAQTIGTHIRNYKKHGLDGLTPRPKSGCPKKLSPTQEALLIETVTNKTPSDAGSEPFMTWDCKPLCLWVKREFDVSFTKGEMRDMLLRLDFTYSRPTYSLARASKNRQSAIVTLVEKKSKYIVLLKASRKSQEVKDATLNWLNEQVETGIKTITFDRGKELNKKARYLLRFTLVIHEHQDKEG